MTINDRMNERMAAIGIPGRPYTIASQLDWAEAELDWLEAQLNFSNATITELRGQLEKMAVERDSLKQQLAAEQARAEGLRRNSMYAVQQVRELEAQLAAEQDKALPAWFRIQGLCSMTAVADEIITLAQQLAAAQSRNNELEIICKALGSRVAAAKKMAEGAANEWVPVLRCNGQD